MCLLDEPYNKETFTMQLQAPMVTVIRTVNERGGERGGWGEGGGRHKQFRRWQSCLITKAFSLSRFPSCLLLDQRGS